MRLAAALAAAVVVGPVLPARGQPAAGPDRHAEPVTGMEMVRVPAGCFEMGELDVGVVGRVCLRTFWLGRFEVTNAQFRRFRPSHRSGSFRGESLDGDDQPVVNISWRDAAAFAAWLAERTGRRFRLPSEAEWEYAARAGTTTAWPWGATDDEAYRFANLQKRPNEYRTPDRFVVTAPVGSFAPNAFGLHDMIGNASEWVADGWTAGGNRYGGKVDAPFVEPSGALRVRRGGSFDEPPRQARSGSRDFYGAEFGVPQTGFRLVMEP